MSHGNVYRHFASKDALAAEIAARWMEEMREACDLAVKRNRTVRTKLRALVEAIRSELFKRANDPEALSVFHFVIQHKPEEAIAHHLHRQGLVVSILRKAGWPPSPQTDLEALTILDALRFFTDPHAVAAYPDTDVSDRLARIIDLLAKHIETTVPPQM
ncbi:MAG: TetR/AcrR family transcriptional regulator [Pseudomonadota bacterium]